MATQYDSTTPRRYDPSMSRRTRRSNSNATINSQDQDEEKLLRSINDLQHLSLKELMEESNGEAKSFSNNYQGSDAVSDEVVIKAAVEEKGDPAMVTKHSEIVRGAKMAGTISRCVKVLNQLIKTKRSSKKKKNVVPLMMK